MSAELPEISQDFFRAVDEARPLLHALYPSEFSELYPVITLLEDIPGKIVVCIALKGVLSEKIPPYFDDWRDHTEELTLREHRTLSNMAAELTNELLHLGVDAHVTFDSQERIDSVGAFFYFR